MVLPVHHDTDVPTTRALVMSVEVTSRNALKGPQKSDYKYLINLIISQPLFINKFYIHVLIIDFINSTIQISDKIQQRQFLPIQLRAAYRQRILEAIKTEWVVCRRLPAQWFSILWACYMYLHRKHDCDWAVVLISNEISCDEMR